MFSAHIGQADEGCDFDYLLAGGKVPEPEGGRPEWYYARGRQKVGPFSLAGLQQEVAAGRLGAADMVWRQGTPRWVPVGTLGLPRVISIGLNFR